MGCNRVFDRVLLGQSGHRVGRVTPGHDFFYFLSTRPGSSPGLTRRAGPGFKTMRQGQSLLILTICT